MRFFLGGAALGLLLALAFFFAPKSTIRHFAANKNFDAAENFVPLRAGFNLADVSTPGQLDKLPRGVEGLVWVGRCAGVDERFKSQIAEYASRTNVFGFYLMDDPDPTGKWRPRCDPDLLRAEADWIHAHLSRAKVFVSFMNMGDARTPAFSAEYAPSRSHVDLFGVAPYPCRTNGACDFEMIGRFVRAAEAAGVPARQIVPTYQVFGGGHWSTSDGEGAYRLPTPGEMDKIFAAWSAYVASPEMDFAYSWSEQRDDLALESEPDLQQAFLKHNR